MSSVERKWWFFLPLMVLACLSTLFLFRSAQVPSTGSLAYFLIFALCSACLHRVLSFLTWLLLLWLAPKLADRRIAAK